jgi:hypothetical protein
LFEEFFKGELLQKVNILFDICYYFVITLYLTIVVALAVAVFFISRFIRKNNLSKNRGSGLNMKMTVLHFVNEISAAVAVVFLTTYMKILRNKGQSCLKLA